MKCKKAIISALQKTQVESGRLKRGVGDDRRVYAQCRKQWEPCLSSLHLSWLCGEGTGRWIRIEVYSKYII